MSGTFIYLTRIIPALSVIGIAIALVFSFVITPYERAFNGEDHEESSSSQLFISAYMVFLHVLGIIFPARLCWAIGDVMRGMKESSCIDNTPERRECAPDGRKKAKPGSPPLFVILLPAYKEEIETLQETLRVLASHPQARHWYHVYLALEQKENQVISKAASLLQSFRTSFHKMNYTMHPSGIPGEAQGKSSNVSWAAKRALKVYADAVKENVIVTVMDADTHLSQRYFAQVSRHHMDDPVSSQETIYIPPIVFDRNLDQVPLFVRTADLMWAGAGISTLSLGSSVAIPTSVYSLPMTLVEEVGGWDTGPGAIGEDMHMYLKCFFALSGNLRTKVIYAPASQCNVSSDRQGFVGYLDSLNARYRQALRHMWGSLDSGYAVWQTCKMIRRHSQTRRPEIKGNEKSINKLNVLTLFVRLFEAHFLPLHFAMIVTATGIFEIFSNSVIPKELATALYYAGYSRWTGWLLVLFCFHRFEAYLRLCAESRREEMRRAGLHSREEGEDERRGNFCSNPFPYFGLLGAGTFPIGGFLFGAIPACQAVLSHLFTDKLVYHVSLKPQLLGTSRSSSSSSSVQQKASLTPLSTPWRRQAFTPIEHLTAALRYRPVQRED